MPTCESVTVRDGRMLFCASAGSRLLFAHPLFIFRQLVDTARSRFSILSRGVSTQPLPPPPVPASMTHPFRLCPSQAASPRCRPARWRSLNAPTGTVWPCSTCVTTTTTVATAPTSWAAVSSTRMHFKVAVCRSLSKKSSRNPVSLRFEC